jgi:ABC-2 type transport system ATP-binding protein
MVADIFGLSANQKKKRIDELLKLVNLSQTKNKRIGSYSNGMKQRLGIAQALMNRPKVLILDEPVSALDPIGRKEVMEILEDLKKETTIFMSTHILADVDRICDEVAIINGGKLIVQSSLTELKAKFANSILEVEFTEDPHKIILDLDREDWVKQVKKQGNLLRIWLTDEKVLDDNTPLKVLSKHGIGILHYGINLPQVEDLFVEAVEKK